MSVVAGCKGMRPAVVLVLFLWVADPSSGQDRTESQSPVSQNEPQKYHLASDRNLCPSGSLLALLTNRISPHRVERHPLSRTSATHFLIVFSGIKDNARSPLRDETWTT